LHRTGEKLRLPLRKTAPAASAAGPAGKKRGSLMILTTLCYIEKDGAYLMLHRTKKEEDINAGKWIGVGGKFLPGESPGECLVREVMEETGLTLTSFRFRGFITFSQEESEETEYMCLYTADAFSGADAARVTEGETVKSSEGSEMPVPVDCSEGELRWVKKEDVLLLNLWEGDRAFLKLLAEDAPFFTMKLTYRGDVLTGCSWEFV